MKKIKTAVFGGTFDPVHCGHIGIARELIDNGIVDELLFLPAATPPHKLGKEITSPAARLRMLQLAIEEEACPGIAISTYELERTDAVTSYSWQTMEELKSRYPERQLFFLMGMDSLNSIQLWNNYLHFIDDNDFIIYTRPESTPPSREKLAGRLAGKQLEQQPDRLEYFPSYDLEQLSDKLISAIVCLRDYPVSSTNIRTTVTKGGGLDGRVPEAVQRYIHEHGLYKTVR